MKITSSKIFVGGLLASLSLVLGLLSTRQSATTQYPLASVPPLQVSLAANNPATGPKPAAASLIPDWTWQHPLPQSNTLYSISCPGPDDSCLAVGDAGTFLSYDGANWTVLASLPTTKTLYSLACTGPGFCLAVATNQATFKYDGTNWTQLPPLIPPPGANSVRPKHNPSTYPLYGVTCLSATSCFAVGQENILSFNGTEWSNSLKIEELYFNSVACPGPLDCWAVGTNVAAYGVVFHYDGVSWTAFSGIPASTRSLYALSCPASNKCLAVGDAGSILEYDGKGWTAPANPPTSQNLRGLFCKAASDCVAVGVNGAILTYNGTGWAAATSPAQTTLLAVGCSPSGQCHALGQNGIQLSYTGANWTVISARLTSLNLSALSCPTVFNCWAGGSNGLILRYKDWEWSIARPAISATTGQNLSDLSCATINRCVGVGANGLILSYTGSQWVTSTVTPAVTAALYSVSCPASNRCWAVGAGGTILAYNGANWIKVTGLPTTNDLYKVSCPAIDRCWAAGASGTILSYSGPSGWSLVTPSPTSLYIFSLNCPSIDFCLAVTNQNTALIYDGNSWQSQALPLPADIYPTDVSCGAPGHCVVATGRYYFLNYDTGSGWTVQNSNNGGAFQRVRCPAQYNCFAVGDRAAIMAAISVLDVTEPADDGSASVPGSLSYVISQTFQLPNRQIRFKLPPGANQTINLTGSASFEIPPGTALNGGCSNGPGITLQGVAAVSLKGNNTLNGLRLAGSNAQLLAGGANGDSNNKLACVAVSKN